MSRRDPVELLLPRPRRAEPLADAWRPPGAVSLVLAAAGPLARRAAERLGRGLAGLGLEVGAGDPGAAGGVRLTVSPGIAVGPEGYLLVVGPRGVELAAAAAAGLFHGTSTLQQWLELTATGHPPVVPGLRVEDAPALAERGVMLDVSRDKVPRLETLHALVDLLASFKVNRLQLYLEHAFAYRGHEAVWREASPLTPEEVRELAAYCAERAIELVPNQNSFGHFHRWLVHDRYRPLAECPEGVEHPFSLEPEPFSLCATDPRVLDLLADLYDQLLPCFAGRDFNVGLDESFDLGRCRSRAAVEARGQKRVYLEFLLAVHRLVAARGRRMQFWGDIVLEEPAVIPELPPDAVAMVWGYEAGHPFVEQGESFRAAGLPFQLCPGTSSWSSLTGRTSNMVDNLAEAGVAALATGAAGMLVTDWGDFGHLQPLAVALPGFAAGAAAAWNPAAPVSREALPALLDAHVFHDPAGVTGRTVADLGDTYRIAGGGNRNGTAYFRLLLHPDRPLDDPRVAGLTAESLAAARDHLAAAVAPLPAARPGVPDAPQILAELAWAAEAAGFACRLVAERLAAGGEAPGALPAALRRRLAADLEGLLERRRTLWLARNRPGGLDHALAFLAPLARRLEGTASPVH
jgi:hypothetical protein